MAKFVTEFKINKALTGEISELRNSGNLINDSYSEIPIDNVRTLKTSVNIISQHNEIKRLLDLYKELILKDAEDLDDLIAEAIAMDTAISSLHNT